MRAVGFVSGPLLLRSGVSEELVHITDWMPTLLHLAGANSSQLVGLDGVNQWHSISTGELSPREVSVYIYLYKPFSSGCKFKLMLHSSARW